MSDQSPNNLRTGTADEPTSRALAAQLAESRREAEELRGLLRSATARERDLASELQHRVRNVLAVVRSLYRRTFDGSVMREDRVEHFQGRFDTIARYQADIISITQGGADLEDMVRDALLEVGRYERQKFTVDGPMVRLHHKSAELMALAIHELSTNSIKFGALGGEGNLRVEWTLDDLDGATVLDFRWQETGVDRGDDEAVPGFGQDLIEEALPYQIGATTAFGLTPDGMHCSIRFPLPAANDPASAR